MTDSPPNYESQNHRAVLVYHSKASSRSHPFAGDGQIIKLKAYNTIIGKDRADINIADSAASSPHCQLQQVGEDFQVFDMNSSGGTFVNGKRITKGTTVKDGDIIRVGHTEFEFRWLKQDDIADLTSSQKVFIP